MFDRLCSKRYVGDVVWWTLGEDTAETAPTFEWLGGIFSPELEFVVTAYRGEELA